MSRLYDALTVMEPEPEQVPRSIYPLVYRGAATGRVYLQQLRYPYQPYCIGSVTEAEIVREALTAFLEGEREAAK